MKRGAVKTTISSNAPVKKPLESEPLGLLQFSLLPDARVTPRDLEDFENYYCGDVLIHACPRRPALVGTRINMKVSNMISTTPYYIYGAAQVELRQKTTLVIDHKAACCEAKRIKPGAWSESDVAHFVGELTQASPTWSAHIERVLQRVASIDGSALAALMVRLKPGSSVLHELDLVRLPYASMLFPYLLGTSADPKRKKTFHALKTHQLMDLHRLLSTAPWDLVWRSPMRTLYRLDPIKQTFFERIVRDMGIVVPPHIHYAMRIYFNMVGQRDDDKHTLFLRGSYNTVLPCMERSEREKLESAVYAYLYDRDVVFVEPHYLALKHDYKDAVDSRAFLAGIEKRSVDEPEPKLRGESVPQLYPVLTARQQEIVTHIRHHWLTIVEGLPGTGKTALITSIFSHYKRVMMTSFVGAMVRSLQKRNGGRREVAHTIHHLLCVAKYQGEDAKQWLSWFEVLIVDEFSNVSMRLFAKLLTLFPNVRKIILVGDHRQLQPIDCGNPMADMLSRYGSHLLRDNLRVVPALAALQEAPKLIAEGKATRIKFSDAGPLTLVPRLLDTKRMLRNIFEKISSQSLLSTHIVLLLNNSSDGRHAVNRAAMEAYEEMGVLRPPMYAAVYIRHGVTIYAGCKITILKNYNVPIEVRFGTTAKCKSDPVCNGELFIVKSVDRCSHPARGVKIVVTDSTDDSDMDAIRTLWIDKKQGIHPGHVDHGYATTTFKTQGERERERESDVLYLHTLSLF